MSSDPGDRVRPMEHAAHVAFLAYLSVGLALTLVLAPVVIAIIATHGGH